MFFFCFFFLVPRYRSHVRESLSFLLLPEYDFTKFWWFNLMKQADWNVLVWQFDIHTSPLSSEVIYAIHSVSPPNHACIFLMFGLCVDWINCLIKYYMTHNHTRCPRTSCTAQILCVIPFLDRASFWQNDIWCLQERRKYCWWFSGVLERSLVHAGMLMFPKFSQIPQRLLA